MKDFLEKWKREDLLNSIDEFNKLYENRPIKDNDGGMKSPHMFPAWFIVNQMKPKYLIESGVWKGLGTWFFEKASPTTKIISIDPEPRFRVYTSPNSTYQTEDFLKTDWGNLPKDDTLIFFDDHQNFFERLKHAHNVGFTKVMTEDNYPYQQGDCYTPKKILSNRNYVIDNAGNREWYDKNDDDLKYFTDNVSIYQEMPPLFKDDLTRWGDKWGEEYPTPTQLLNNDDKSKYSVFFEEKKDYTWICYMELNKKQHD
jgi:hypothetical protein